MVLVFDGDAAGQSAADRALEFFLGHELDLRVLTLPANLDPCDFLLKEGAEAFRELVERALDPLAFVLERAGPGSTSIRSREARRAAEWVLGILSRIPAESADLGLEVKLAKVARHAGASAASAGGDAETAASGAARTAGPRPGRDAALPAAPASRSRGAADAPPAEQAAAQPPIRLADLDRPTAS